MKPTYEELEAKCQLQQDKLDAINKLMGVIESASDLAKDGIANLEQQLSESRREFTAANATIHNLELQLADAEARGVDKFATEIGSVYKQLRPGSNHAHALKSVVFRAVEFAAQLRQGAE